MHYFRADYERVVELATANLAVLPADRVNEYFGGGAPPSVNDRLFLVMSLAQLADSPNRRSTKRKGSVSLPSGLRRARAARQDARKGRQAAAEAAIAAGRPG